MQPQPAVLANGPARPMAPAAEKDGQLVTREVLSRGSRAADQWPRVAGLPAGPGSLGWVDPTTAVAPAGLGKLVQAFGQVETGPTVTGAIGTARRAQDDITLVVKARTGGSPVVLAAAPVVPAKAPGALGLVTAGMNARGDRLLTAEATDQLAARVLGPNVRSALPDQMPARPTTPAVDPNGRHGARTGPLTEAVATIGVRLLPIVARAMAAATTDVQHETTVDQVSAAAVMIGVRLPAMADRVTETVTTAGGTPEAAIARAMGIDHSTVPPAGPATPQTGPSEAAIVVRTRVEAVR